MHLKTLLMASALSMPLMVPAFAADQSDNPYATHHELGLMQGFPPPPEKMVTRDTALFGVPQNRWSYQNMRFFYPSVNIPASTNPRALAKAPDGGIERLTIAHPDGGDATVEDFL